MALEVGGFKPERLTQPPADLRDHVAGDLIARLLAVIPFLHVQVNAFSSLVSLRPEFFPLAMLLLSRSLTASPA